MTYENEKVAVLPKMDKAIKRFEPTNTKDIYMNV